MAKQGKWDQLFKEIRDIKFQITNVEAKLDSSIRRLDQNLERLTEHVNEQLQTAFQKISEVEMKLQDQFKTFESKYIKQQILADLYSKKNNLIIHGLPERGENEKRDKSLQLVKSFLTDQLKIHQPIAILDAHRLRARKTNDGRPVKSRPLIFKLSNIFDKNLIMSNLKNLKPDVSSTRQIVYVNQHLPVSMVKQKAKLYGKFKLARRQNKRTRWSIDYSTAEYCLFIDEIKVIPEV